MKNEKLARTIWSQLNFKDGVFQEDFNFWYDNCFDACMEEACSPIFTGNCDFNKGSFIEISRTSSKDGATHTINVDKDELIEYYGEDCCKRMFTPEIYEAEQQYSKLLERMYMDGFVNSVERGELKDLQRELGIDDGDAKKIEENYLVKNQPKIIDAEKKFCSSIVLEKDEDQLMRMEIGQEDAILFDIEHEVKNQIDGKDDKTSSSFKELLYKAVEKVRETYKENNLAAQYNDFLKALSSNDNILKLSDFIMTTYGDKSPYSNSQKIEMLRLSLKSFDLKRNMKLQNNLKSKDTYEWNINKTQNKKVNISRDDEMYRGR